jgi:hypothetical protein
MSPVDGKDDLTPLAALRPRSRRSRTDPANLAAAAEADRIPVGRRWAPAWTLLLVIAVPAAFWVLVALLLARR